MAVRIDEIISTIEEHAPLSIQESWDNSGLQVGDIYGSVRKVLIAMDITDKCIEYAIENNYELIITHHPFIFTGVKSIDYNKYKGKVILDLIQHGISVYSAHTNLDKAEDGTNNVLAEILQLENVENLMDDELNNIGVYGTFPGESLENLIGILKDELVPSEYIRYYGKWNEVVFRVALLGGSGASEIEWALHRECEVFITSDVKYHDGQMAYENDLTLIDIGHFYSEFPVLSQLQHILKTRFKEIDIDIFCDPVFILEP